MKLKTKRISIAILSAVCALLIVAGATLLVFNNAKTAFAEDNAATSSVNTIPSSEYYYDNLTDAEGKEYTLAKKFYKVLDNLNKDGDFKDGVVEYDLKEIVTSEEIANWVSKGDLTVPKAFSAARDSYFYDHPELFYIDIYKLTLSAGRIGSNYVAYIDCGREANCYLDGGFASEAEVNKAITDFNEKIDEIEQYVKTEAAKDELGTATEVLYAQLANRYIATNTVYDDDAYSNFVSTGSHEAPYAQNAYGALILGKSVCYGYSFAYKAVMDRLGVPCLVIGGTSVAVSGDGKSSSNNGEAHAWNYVWFADTATAGPEEQAIATLADEVTGSWFAYDVTWNSSRTNKNTYVNMAAFAASQNHLPDPVISTSNYEMPYPSLSVKNYGTTVMSGGIMVTQEYLMESIEDAFGTDEIVPLLETVSFNDKGAVKLYEDGLRLVYRQAIYDDKGNLIWSYWTDLYADYMYGPFGISGGGAEQYTDSGNQFSVMLYPNVLYTQYAVLEGLEPNMAHPNFDHIVFYTSENPKLAENPEKSDIGDYIVNISDVIENKAYKSYVAAPYVVKTSLPLTTTQIIYDWMAAPNSSIMADKYAYEIKVTYDEPLGIIDTTKPMSVYYTTKYEFANLSKYAVFVPYADGSLVKLSEDGYTLSFKFKPSLMFEHNRLMYSFGFDNIGSKQIHYKADGTTFVSNKAPNHVPYCFSRECYIGPACPLRYGPGKFWVDCCAFPKLVSDSNLAETQFEDENGDLFTTNMSQMMLVVENASEKTENEILDGIADIENSSVTRDDIKKSETYEIDLQTCGKYSKIPDGSMVKISLGFPEGYGPENEGVVFKVYHKKHIKGDEYIIEEIPCVVTKLGIVASVSSFSPYMVAAVDASKASADKTIYATVDGRGGKLSMTDSNIKTVKEGESVSFAITPDEGYQIYRITLNEKDVTAKVVDGQLTLTYDEIDSNSEVEIQYIANAAAERYASIEAVTPVKVYVPVEDQPQRPTAAALAKPSDFENGNNNGTGNETGTENGTGTTPADKDNTGLIIACVVIAVVVIAGAAVAFVVIKKRRESNED